MPRPTIRDALDVAKKEEDAPADLESYQDFDVSDPLVTESVTFTNGPHVPLTYSRTNVDGTLSYGWDVRHRIFVWGWEPPNEEDA